MRIAPAAAFALVMTAPASAAKLDMIAFFTGRTHADNQIKIAFHSAHRLVVDSVGRTEGGAFVLVDTIHEEGKPVRTRKWVMRPAGANHFTGTLSDAAGPVDVAIDGDTATIRYVMKEGRLSIVEQMQLQRDGTLSNHATARKFGLKFASVDGTVRKLD